jgi:hypothetical protein
MLVREKEIEIFNQSFAVRLEGVSAEYTYSNFISQTANDHQTTTYSLRCYWAMNKKKILEKIDFAFMHLILLFLSNENKKSHDDDRCY